MNERTTRGEAKVPPLALPPPPWGLSLYFPIEKHYYLSSLAFSCYMSTLLVISIRAT